MHIAKKIATCMPIDVDIPGRYTHAGKPHHAHAVAIGQVYIHDLSLIVKDALKLPRSSKSTGSELPHAVITTSPNYIDLYPQSFFLCVCMHGYRSGMTVQRSTQDLEES